MPNWIYEKQEIKETPSFLDNIDSETEARFRKEGAKLIQDVGTAMNLRYDTAATAVVYFHRFYMHHSFKDFHRYVGAMGCLFLAGKVEETPKKCRDMLQAAKKNLGDGQFTCFGEDPREEIMIIERILLQTIKFDLHVDHPYEFLLKYAKLLKADKAKINKVLQMAWTFVNDSLCTTLCLQWEPEVIAVALIYLASRLSKCEITDWHNKKGYKTEKWWDQIIEDLPMELIDEICHQVLDLYSATAAPAPKEKGAQAGSKKSSSATGQQTIQGTSTSSSGLTNSAIHSSSPSSSIVRSDATKLPQHIPTLGGAASVEQAHKPSSKSAPSTPQNAAIHSVVAAAPTPMPSLQSSVQSVIPPVPPNYTGFLQPPPPPPGAPSGIGAVSLATPIQQQPTSFLAPPPFCFPPYGAPIPGFPAGGGFPAPPPPPSGTFPYPPPAPPSKAA